ncbi:carbamoyltransferase HypF [bacterium]|nr:carbamoyltransferase HypF [bacterium]
MIRYRVSITGIVQGVGFRPHVHKLAEEFGIFGWVLNNSSGVTMEIEPPSGQGRAHLDRFLSALVDDKPPLSRILTLEISELPPVGFTEFGIRKSERIAGELTLISPDVAICDDCKRELFDESDRRYEYPFINCTNCGPRYTIIRNIPYDRAMTTMASFEMCPDCEREYRDVEDRRYHAQPDCCWDCGPHVEYLRVESMNCADEKDAMTQASYDLSRGLIVGIKGLGGFHLACDAKNADAIETLRKRKRRAFSKPFAIMVRDISAAKAICDVNDAEAKLLESGASPIVLLRRKALNPHLVCSEVAPGQNRLGVMLAYTPLHLVLFKKLEEMNNKDAGNMPVLVMTSGNISEEPLVANNDEAIEKLSELADGFLVHNREIHAKCDDSVARVIGGQPQLIRHSRGYSPFPISFSTDGPMILAVGAQKKNTFTLTRERFGFLSPHMGDMENLETLEFFEKTLEHYRKLFTIEPEAVVCDMHPHYLITGWAKEYAAKAGLKLIEVQHHHAHMAAVLAEHGESGTALGVSFDGTGYGTDGTLWGGEFLIGDMRGFRRYGHFHPVMLAGGESAIREPWRVAVAMVEAIDDRELAERFMAQYERMLAAKGESGAGVEAARLADVRLMLERNLNRVPTSSCGRLFDGISALLGICKVANYEGQAAILLEERMVGEHDSGACEAAWMNEDGKLVFDWRHTIQEIVKDVLDGVPAGVISAEFHRTVVDVICNVAHRARDDEGIELVTLSGGCFQNAYLVEKTLERLCNEGFKVLYGCLVPPNDAGISLGQAAIGRSIL